MSFNRCYGHGSYDVFMIGLLWKLTMRMLRFFEMASGQVVTALPDAKGPKRSSGQGNAGDMTEDNQVNVHPPTAYEPDLNSNCAPLTATATTDTVTTSRLSNVSSNDGDLVHDTSDYQWFADLGYKDQQNQGQRPLGAPPSLANGRRRRHHPRSIFAALNSPNGGGDFTYEDLSRNIDVNLAEIDMEDFRSEDINSILALPAMYCGDFQRSQNRGEQAASLSGSIMAAAFDSSTSTAATSCCCARHSCTTSGDSADMSVCKSEPLFSPLKDGLMPATFSVDSLDCDSYDEHELMLTCRTNMNNYTIAFEGSFAKCSDDSDYHEAAGSETSDSESWSGQFKVRASDSVDGSLVRSDFAYTTWSKLKRASSEAGPEAEATARTGNPQSPSAACKSQSLPNLFRKAAASIGTDIEISQLNVSTDSEQCVPVYDVHSSCSQSRCSDTSSQHSVSLMRLFMQRTESGNSIAHSLSSGALRQMDAYGGSDDSATSADQRLRCVLNGQMYDSSGSSICGDEGSGLRAHPGPHQHHGKIHDSACKNALKGRRSKTAPVHEDGAARAGSPLASPIQEEDENEESMSGSGRIVKSDGRIRIDGMMDIGSSDSMDGSDLGGVSGTDRDPGRSVADRSMGTQTKGHGKPSPQLDSCPARIGSPYWRSKSSNEGSGRGANDASSSSSGYKSIRNSDQSVNARRKTGSLIATVRSRGTQIPVHVSDEAIQTSFKGEWLQKVLANCARMRVRDRVVQVGCGVVASTEDPGSRQSAEQTEQDGGPEADDKKAVYVCYPNYALPDLAFLRSPDGHKSMPRMILVPTKPALSPCSQQRTAAATMARYFKTRESLKRADLSHIQDWDSLNVLLPQEVRDMLTEIKTRNGSENQETGGFVPKIGEEEEEAFSSTTEEGCAQSLGYGPNNQDIVPSCGIQAPITLQSLTSRKDNRPCGHGNGTGTEHRKPPPLPKRSISLPQGDSSTPRMAGLHQVATKPPLPKSILRRSSASTGSERQRQSPQRYSMSDFLALQQQQERHLNRHGGHMPVAEQCDCFMQARNLAQELQTVDKCPLSGDLAKMLGMSGCGCDAMAGNAVGEPQMGPCPCCRDDRDRDRISPQCRCQPLEDPAVAEDDESQQAQDAKNKKTVSFSYGLRPKNDQFAEQRRCLGLSPDGGSREWPSLLSEDSDCGAPRDFCVSPLKDSDSVRAPTLTSPELNFSGSFLQRKRDLVAAVVDAIEVLNAHFGKAKDPHCKFIIGSGLQTPLTGYKVIHQLCPALFAILSDGLRQEVYNLFGHVGNSVWMVVEAVAQSGHCTKQMSDLVVHVNNEQGLWEKHMKFNAFVFGLLNIRSLDTWLSLLGTCGSILQKHYSPSAFLHSTGSVTKALFDELLLSAQTLSLLPFDLDLALETKLGSRPETQSGGCDYNRNCLLHGDLACCHSWVAAALSKSTPATGQESSPRSSPMARRSGIRLQDRGASHRQDGSPTSPKTPDHRLHRGYSQDSAIATGSETSGTMPDDEVPRRVNVRSPQRPRSCADYASGKANRTNDSVPLDKRLSCGTLDSKATYRDSGTMDRLKGSGDLPRDKRCEMIGNLDYREPFGTSNRDSWTAERLMGMGDFPRDKRSDEANKIQEATETKDPLIMDLIVNPDAQSRKKAKELEDEEEGARQYAEKGALDATIAEDRDSQNNIKDAEEEKPGEEDEDGAKFKELQLRWEILSCADKKQQRSASATARSKIPRLVAPQLRSGSRMEDSAVSVRTSATSGICSPEGSNYKTLTQDAAFEEEASARAKTRLNPPESGRSNRPVPLKVAAGQPTLVVKTSADRSPVVRKRSSPRRAAGGPVAAPQVKHRQSVSRGVGGPDN